MIPQYAAQVRKTREPGNLVHRRVNWRKYLARRVVYLLVVLVFVGLCGLANGIR